jgi:DNA-binding transcriptional ArsR family regulator
MTSGRPRPADELGPIFDALADPTRRWVVSHLADGASLTATELAGQRPMTRQAAAKHLAALADAGLVTTHRAGRERRYALDPSRLRTATAWLQSVGAAWDTRLASLQHRLTGETAGRDAQSRPGESSSADRSVQPN